MAEKSFGTPAYEKMVKAIRAAARRKTAIKVHKR